MRTLKAADERKLKDALAFTERARELIGADDVSGAVPLAERALTIAHALLDENDPRRIDVLRTLATAYVLTDRAGDALPYLGESVRILQQIGTAIDPRLVQDSFMVAQLYLEAGQVPEALPYLGSFVDLSRRMDGGSHEGYPGAVRLLCEHLLSGSQYPAAEALLRENMPVVASRVDEATPFFHFLVERHALVLEACGLYADAATVAATLVRLSATVFGRTSAEYVAGLGRLGSVCRASGDFEGARRHASQVIAICEAAPGLGDSLLGTALWELAECDVAVGEIQQAESHFRRAIELYRTLPETHWNLAQALNGLGNLHRQTGHLAAAHEALAEAYALYARYGEQTLECGQVLSEIAAVHLAGDNFGEAERLMRASIDVIREAAGEQHPAFARSLRDLGVIQESSGDRHAARLTYEQALPALQSALGAEHPLVANHLLGLGDLNRMEGRLDEAEAQLTRALAMYRQTLRGSDHKLRTALHNLAGLYAATNRFDLAIGLMLEALDGEFDMICQLFALSAQEERSRLLAQGSALDPCLTLVTRHGRENASLVRTAFTHVLRRKGMGAEALSAERTAIHAGNHPSLAGALSDLRELRERIARHALAGPGPEGADAHRRSLGEWEKSRTEQEIRLSRDVPELALGARLRAADVDAVHAALSAGSALIDFVQFTPVDLATEQREPPRLLAFVLVAGRGDDVRMIDLGEATPIDALITSLRRSLTGKEETRDVDDSEDDEADGDGVESSAAGQALHAALIHPLRDALTGVHRLFISPDGALHRLPFEILPTAPGRRLIDDCTVSYLGGGRDVLRFGAARSGTPTRPIVIADPDFDLTVPVPVTATDANAPARSAADDVFAAQQRTGLSFGRLTGTRTEGEQVGELLDAECHFGAAAIEHVIKDCHSPRILHLATHGFFLPERGEADAGAPAPARLKGKLTNPMLRSGLALAGANTWLANLPLPAGAEDALLNGEDVSGLDLVATELVVLSACESGLGEIQAGEGVFGVRRAFVLAGAATIVVSLWPVPDTQTQLLICDFYRRLLSGTPRAQALRDAQLALKVSYPSPRYWGAFICVGDPSAIA